MLIIIVGAGLGFFSRKTAEIKSKSAEFKPEPKKEIVTALPWLPSEIILCGEKVPLERDYVRERLIQVLDSEIKGYSSEKLKSLRNSIWFSFIGNELKKAGLPNDLRYLPILESGLNGLAISGKGAKGPWQFVAGTAERYKLRRISPYLDERSDFIASTRAAKDYLKDLYSRFGSWSLALAGYNTGEDGLARTLRKERVDDFYKLKEIPAETQEFSFRLIATKLLFEYPERYGFSRDGWIVEGAYDKWRIIEIPVEIRESRYTISEIVQGIKNHYPKYNPEDFRRFNPHILGDLPRGSYKVYIVTQNGTS